MFKIKLKLTNKVLTIKKILLVLVSPETSPPSFTYFRQNLQLVNNTATWATQKFSISKNFSTQRKNFLYLPNDQFFKKKK